MSEIYYRHGLVRRVLSGQCVVVAAAPSPIFAPSEISAADAIAGAGVVRQTHLQVDPAIPRAGILSRRVRPVAGGPMIR